MGDRAARNALAADWAASEGPALVGRPLVEAEASAAAAGVRTKVVPAEGVTTMEFGIGRVRIAVDAAELVTGVQPG